MAHPANESILLRAKAASAIAARRHLQGELSISHLAMALCMAEAAERECASGNRNAAAHMASEASKWSAQPPKPVEPARVALVYVQRWPDHVPLAPGARVADLHAVEEARKDFLQRQAEERSLRDHPGADITAS